MVSHFCANHETAQVVAQAKLEQFLAQFTKLLNFLRDFVNCARVAQISLAQPLVQFRDLRENGEKFSSSDAEYREKT